MGPVDEIKSRLDTVEFIKGYLKLEKAGANWKALCPFHTEKTPSFFVSPSRQMWHCFGCHKGGDAFKFLMELEHLEFPEALKILAEKTGVELKREDPRLRSERNRLLEILEAAARFFENQLTHSQEVGAYLTSRGLKESTIKEFRLGFAPAGWENLFHHLTSLGFGASEVERAGLAVKRSGETGREGYYDRFRSRIMFPIADTQGRTVGFTGRIFGQADETEAKYVNTPESLVFFKSQILYGFDKTKHEVRKQNAAVLTEGQMDFLMAWQDGVRNIVATSGTALTPWHLSTLKRLCENLYFAFDMDEAGGQATERGIAMAAHQGFNLKIIELPARKDIADFVKETPDKLAEVIGKAIPVMEYYFEKAIRLAQDKSIEALETKKDILRYILPRIKMLKSPVDQAFWLEKLSRKIDIAEAVLSQELRGTVALHDPDYGSPDLSQKISVSGHLEKNRLELIAERALALALRLPDSTKLLAPHAPYFPDPLQRLVRDGFSEDDKEFLDFLGLHGDYIVTLLGDINLEDELAKTLKELRREHIHKVLEGLAREIEVAESVKDNQKIEMLSAKFSHLSKELASL